jgi:hypothetical protein
MVLTKYSNRFGMTFGQLLSVVTILGGLIGFVINSTVQLAEVNQKIQAIDVKYQLKCEALEQGRTKNEYNIEQGRKENREEHQMILDAISDLR